MRENHDLRDVLHQMVLAITNANQSTNTLTSIAYKAHVFETNGKFGHGRVPFGSIGWDPGEGEGAITDTILLLDRRFGPMRSQIESRMRFMVDGQVYVVQDGHLVAIAPQN